MTETSRAEAYLLQKAWEFKHSGDQLVVQECPFCNNPNHKFYINKTTGLWDCKVCGESGNLYKLMAELGDRTEGIMSTREAANATVRPGKLPDVETAHERLLDSEDALEYLVGIRGFTMEVITQQKLGLQEINGSPYIVIPYFSKGNLLYAKFRSIPPAKKSFLGVANREVPLYNQDAIHKGMEELICVEGEPDTLACLSAGIKGVVGIPGANIKKATWIDLIDEAQPANIYILYDNDSVGQKAAREMAARIGLDKVKNILLPPFQTFEGAPGKDINEWFRAGHTLEEFEELKKSAKKFDVLGVNSLGDVLEELGEELSRKETLKPKYDTPWPSLNRRLGGAEEGDRIDVVAEAKCGKMQPLSSLVLTPSGWTTMGSLRVGQEVASVDGEPSFVEKIVPHGVKKVYKVTFSDGRTTRCGAEHLWKVGNSSNFTKDGWRVVDTITLMSLIKQSDEWFVPLFSGHYGRDTELSIDPWLLGALLGDGGFTSGGVHFTKTDPKVIEAVRRKCGEYDTVLNYVTKCTHRIKGTQRGINPILNRLKSLGLIGHRSVTKFIPKQYLEGSRETRLALLRGLMDTDGSCEGKYNTPYFNTSSKELAEQVRYLVHSLGGTAGITSRIPKYTYNGEVRVGQRAYRVPVRLYEPAFMNSEKAQREGVRRRSFRLTITGIVEDGEENCQCIAVSHPSHLYITDNFIVTHNTTAALNWADYIVERYEDNAMVYCLEMTRVRLARKWVSYITQTDDSPAANEEEGKARLAEMKSAVERAKEIARNRKADLLFAHTTANDPQDVYDTIREAVRRYGVKFVVFDNLQLLADLTLKSASNRTVHISQISKNLKALAVELGIVIICIVQPNRVKENEIVDSRNVDGSSQIEKDCDAMIVFHRPRKASVKASDFEAMKYLECDDTFEPQMLAKVSLSRYAGGGICTLWMHGSTSTVSECPSEGGISQGARVGSELPIEEA